MADENTNSRIRTAERLARIEEKLDGIADKLECLGEYDERLRTVETDVATVKERQTLVAVGLGVLNTIAAWAINRIMVRS